MPDSTAKAPEYKRLFEDGTMVVQSVSDARADPPVGFLVVAPPPVPAAAAASGPGARSTCWRQFWQHL